jgi:cellobiose transport system permease protein
MIFVILTMTIGGLQVFDEARMFDGTGTGGTGQGGSDNQWLTTVLYLFNLGFGDWQDRMGQAAAVAWLFAVVIVVFTLLNFFLTRSIASSGSKPGKVSSAVTKELVARAKAAGEASARAAAEAGVPTLVGAARPVSTVSLADTDAAARQTVKEGSKR